MKNVFYKKIYQNCKEQETPQILSEFPKILNQQWVVPLRFGIGKPNQMSNPNFESTPEFPLKYTL
jgi:hypothetical protein